VITKVPKGTKLELIEEGGTGRDRWFRVKLASGQVGWIAASAVTED
jgi:uncharacterized protein YgiM (DUF1202 family)